MNLNDFELNLENEWLQKVLKEANRQLEEKRREKDKLKKDAIETQRELWSDLGAISIENGLEQLSEFMSFMDVMKHQKRSHEFTEKLKDKYEKMIESPYFGRIDFTEDNEVDTQKCYIGLSNLIDDDYDFFVYDWRAPISSMFYDYEIGQASYDCPEGLISGAITKKRQYKIKDRKIEYMFDSNLNIDDDVLQELLGKNSDEKMKTIVTTIQREQNQVIRNEDYKNLIVQGAAGSGKTSIALHRIAYLLYRHKDKITSKNIIIFSPNNIFNDYISNVLPQLGEDNICQTTFKDYMHQELGNDFKKESPSEMMEYIFDNNQKITYRDRIENIEFKTSSEFVDILKKYITHLETEDRCFEDIIVRGKLIISSKDLQDLFSNDYSNLPIKRRLEKIKSRIMFLIEPYEKIWVDEIFKELEESGDYIEKEEMIEKSTLIVKENLKEIYSKVLKMTELDLIDTYKNLFENLELFLDKTNIEYDKNLIDNIRTYTMDNLSVKSLYYEDQIALLYLKGVLGGIPNTSQIKYVIIDEAQDYSPLQYEIFYKLFNSANMTILGDINQSINPFMNVGDYNNIHDILKNDTCIINLSKTYRSTMEITRFSRKLLTESINDEYVERHGDEPKIIGFKDKNQLNKKLIEDIKGYKKKNYNSVGIITKTVREAREVYEFLKENDVDVQCITKDDDEYINGVLIMPSYLSKGLEFDVVIIYNASNKNYNNEDERLLLYTCCTRALHVLNIYYLDEISSLLKQY
ncbi:MULTISPECIES: RNA polymerase recycling motor HelD [unclassified Clostridioides]|uniref:RNA polymerase recycling motor HelD n=1 Tax=unclassified Clostridioides TaxID=2635829 RepID=UPI001D114E89|nr:UvrD-helicase domain-containing protein [Clostridioides sp. ES-S-0049-03]MCC0675977.1 UvrD-helicase domain-containing protein [Clostridioides sp. ES-W-0018-02]MCC0710944.1 UvrD-helicase domain-containing protein [Clostridioides sp. ES-W-0017-02]